MIRNNKPDSKINFKESKGKICHFAEKLKNEKVWYYYAPYNADLQFRQWMDFDLKDMKQIIDEEGDFTNIVSK